MPDKCVVPGCRSNYLSAIKDEGYVRVFQFPKNEVVRNQWLRAIRRPNWTPNKRSVVCIKHFRKCDLQQVEFYRAHWSGKWLSFKLDKPVLSNYNAVPSVFSFITCDRFYVERDTLDEMRDKRKHGRKNLRAKSEHDVRTSCMPSEAGSNKVEFKPEMWEEKDKESEDVDEKLIVRKARGRPRKKSNIETPILNGNLGLYSEATTCCALACTNSSDTHSMTRLPDDPDKRKLWIEKIDRLDWLPEPDCALCEIHFEEDMWDRNLEGEKSLKPEALPTLFLHGEAIKSWVTLEETTDDTDVQDQTNGHAEEDEVLSSEAEEEGGDEDQLLVKHEALEPEIDMVEGSEGELTRDDQPREQFETIYCDANYATSPEDMTEDQLKIKQEFGTGTGFREEEEEKEEEENPFRIESVFSTNTHDLNGETHGSDGMTDESSDRDYYGSYDHLKKKIIRRSSSQLTDEFQCPICSRRLSRRKNLEIHVQKLHPNGEMTEYQKRRKEEKLREIYLQKKKEELKAREKQLRAKKRKDEGLLHSGFRPILIKNGLSVTTSLVPSSIAQVSPSILRGTLLPQPSLTVTTPPTVALSPSGSDPPPMISPTPSLLVTSPTTNISPSPGPLIASTTVVSTPRPLDPSPAGGEMKKQFLLLLPQQTNLPEKSPTPPVPKTLSADDSEIYSVDLSSVPAEQRFPLKWKLRELIDAVVSKNLNPEKIIIAYDRTS